VATLGEIYALRALETDNEAGTPQYTPGQHFARMVSVDTASLSFVDRGRHVCIIPVHKHEDGQWYHLGSSIRVGPHAAPTVWPLTQAGYNLSDSMLEALGEAEARYAEKKRKKASSQ
jgi:hypothetical protein